MGLALVSIATQDIESKSVIRDLLISYRESMVGR